MVVRDALYTQVKEALAAMSLRIEDFDQARLTKEQMYVKLGEIVGQVIGLSFDFGFVVGCSSEPEDIPPGGTLLDIELTELGEDDAS